MPYDAVLDRIVKGGDQQARRHATRVIQSQEVLVTPPDDPESYTVDFPCVPFHSQPTWGRYTTDTRVNNTIDGKERGALAAVHTNPVYWLDLWEGIISGSHYPLPEDDEERIDRYTRLLGERTDDGTLGPVEYAPSVKTPRLRLTEFGDAAIVPDGINRALAHYRLHKRQGTVDDALMPVYVFVPNRLG